MPPELSKLSSALHTRIVNRKSFGYDSYSGNAGDDSDMIPSCYQGAVGKMKEVAENSEWKR